MDTPIMLLVAALIAASILGAFNRIVGGVAGVIICLGVGAWGLVEMNAGKIIAFFGRPLTKTSFLLLVGVLVAINVVQIARGFKMPSRKKLQG